MNPSQDFNRLYTDVSNSIATAMGEIAGIKVDHKDGKQELSNIKEKLLGIQTHFDGELDLLEKHAEWDKFTMAFFGETNAGKSTIIESLRILFKEDSRQQLLHQNGQDLVKYEQALIGHVNQVREGLSKIYAKYAAEIVAIKQSIVALDGVLQDESSARLQIEQKETAARLQMGQDESSARLQIEQKESSARMERKPWLFAICGVVVGSIVAGAIALLIRVLT